MDEAERRQIVTDLRHPADLYDEAAKEFMATFDDFASENFGERCNEFDKNCPCCRLWKLRDAVREIVIITAKV